ncbi:hypothetical protein E3N88_24039 [Mikania micrantha]|uniref:Uncharacterized protein n=1 Tax=Mikania micrantha TaxID=192012 RepID=A0A5N6NHN7_9ASTR|nr:hypothetical protein E3N88_24039 [Mikania micrantha]
MTRFCYNDRLYTPRSWGMCLFKVHKSQSSTPYTPVAILPALCLGLGLTPVLAEDASTEVTAADPIGLQKIDDGSVGKLEDAERLFMGALEEARQGFGERDPHVASACNNLAELYRVKKAFDKAEPLYLEAINILEESYGHEDIRVGAALHNLGQFYLVQKELEGALACYEIKRRVLGEAHADYAETMYHLGKVLHLQGKGKDAEALIKDSIRILEEAGQGESFLCIRRLQYLVQRNHHLAFLIFWNHRHPRIRVLLLEFTLAVGSVRTATRVPTSYHHCCQVRLLHRGLAAAALSLSVFLFRSLLRHLNHRLLQWW